jgi:hypothetical protein
MLLRQVGQDQAFQNLLARYESVATVSKLTQQNVALAQQNVVLTRDVKRNGRLLEVQFDSGTLMSVMEGQNIDHVGNSSLAAHYWQGTDRHTT